MYCSVLSATVSGMEMIPVQVEADVSDGMPQFTMVGYVSAQVKWLSYAMSIPPRN